MKDERVAEDVPIGPGEQIHEITLNLGRLFRAREADPLSDPADMGVNDDAFRSREGDPKHDIGRLPTNPRQEDELVERPGHLAPMLLHEELRERDDVLRFLAEHSDSIQGGLDCLRSS